MKYKSVAGKSIGEPDDTAILIDENGEPKPLRLNNRWLYVKKCLRRKDMDGIILTDWTRGDTVVSLVLAVSNDCGKWHKLTKEQKARGEEAGINMTIKPHDKIITPDSHPWGIKRSPYGRDEFFIREDIVKAIVQE